MWILVLAYNPLELCTVSNLFHLARYLDVSDIYTASVGLEFARFSLWLPCNDETALGMNALNLEAIL